MLSIFSASTGCTVDVAVLRMLEGSWAHFDRWVLVPGLLPPLSSDRNSQDSVSVIALRFPRFTSIVKLHACDAIAHRVNMLLVLCIA